MIFSGCRSSKCPRTKKGYLRRIERRRAPESRVTCALSSGRERLTSHAGLELGSGGICESVGSPRIFGEASSGCLGAAIFASSHSCCWSWRCFRHGRRLRHVEFLGDDPLVRCITGILQDVPSRRTLARRLGALRKIDLAEIDRLILASAADTIMQELSCGSRSTSMAACSRRD